MMSVECLGADGTRPCFTEIFPIMAVSGTKNGTYLVPASFFDTEVGCERRTFGILK